MAKYKIIFFIAVFCIFGLPCLSFSQEQITITTYYPSPVGSYQQLRSNRMVVDPNRAMPGTNGELAWGNNRGLLTVANGASIELGGTGTPYIDFSNDAVSDYDGRLWLPNNNTLRINATTFEVRNRNDTDWGMPTVDSILMCQ